MENINNLWFILQYYFKYSLKNMFRTTAKNFRDLSSSNQKSYTKKTISTSAKAKFNIPNTSTHSAHGSITNQTKSRMNTASSKSNKKHVMNTSHSNKSLKQLRETTTNNTNKNQAQAIKKTITRCKGQKQQKTGTIMIKNIKSKVVGNTNTVGITTTSKVSKINKQNQSSVISKKSSTKIDNFSNIDHEGKFIRTPRTPREHISEPLYSNIKYRKQVIKAKTVLPKKLSLDMFELGRKLGRGRFGDVYMARDRETGFALAIKVINKKQLKQSEMEAQLIQQIKIQIYSNHPNVLKMYGFFDDDKKIYLLLEIATHGCLFREIRQKAYFTEELACFYFRQVTSGIRYLHSNSVIHRDIKPQNILNCFGVLKICDFGWAIYSPIYQRQTFCGTLDYVPPEIVTGDFYDEKADIWCLGVLCYELCTGKAPFESKTDESQTYDKILKVEIDFPIYLSGKVVDFINKILNRDPQKRMNLQDVESHEWMKLHENEAGRMISKQIWENWMSFSK